MADQIEDTNYCHGDEVTYAEHIDCPERCDVPSGQRLVQIVEPGTAFSVRCPNDCGLAIRWVPGSDG